MNKLNIKIWRGTLTLFCVLCLTACGGGGGGGTIAAPIGDISGAWDMTLITDASACPVDTSKTETPTVEITQSGNSATVVIPGEGTYTASVRGNSLTWSGSYPDDGGTVQTTVSLTIDANCNAMSGLANWTWSDGVSSCAGTTQASGTRNNPVGCGATITDPGASTTITAAQLVGTWLRACEADGTGGSFDASVTFTQTAGELTINMYTDANCSQSQLSMVDVSSFTYILGAAFTLDGTVAGITTGTEFNDTDVNTGITDYDSLALVGTSLYIGDDEADPAKDASSPAARPTKLDATPFIKQ